MSLENTRILGRHCEICQNIFWVTPSALKWGRGKYCSHKCAAIFNLHPRKWYPSGKDHPCWRGGKIRRSNGYITIKMKNHPNANKDGYIDEHRFIMSEYLNRSLSKNEVVHHLNGIKDDNRIENLQLLLKQNHPKIPCICPKCGCKFYRVKNNNHEFK